MLDISSTPLPMKKAYITRYAAFGDHIHASHLPRLLKQKGGYDYVAFEYNPKGVDIYSNNPFIDEHIVFDPQVMKDKPFSFLEKRWEQIFERGNFTKHFNLFNSIEYGYIAMEDQTEYYRSSEYRRKKFGGHNYFDQTVRFLGYSEWVGEKGEIYFTDEEISIIKDIYNANYKDKFVIVCNLSGTSKHKLFYNAEYIIKTFLLQHSDAVCITVGDDLSKKHLEFSGDRIINRCGEFEKGKRYSFRQSMGIVKFANMTIGCESGLMVASTVLGCPTVQLMTAASIKNHGGDFNNDYSLQSPAECSPCHKGPYEYIGCPKFDYLNERYPICIKFKSDVVLNRMEQVYDAWSKKYTKTALSIM